MKLYNSNTNTIGTFKSIKTDDGTLYPSKLTEEHLNSHGYYFIELSSPPNRRYYTYTETKGLVGNKYKNTFVITERPLDEVQASMAKDLFEVGEEYENKASVDTGLNFIVDASPRGMSAFALGVKKGATRVRDKNFMPHDVTVPQVNDILTAIEDKLVSIFNTKEDKFDEIMALQDISSCELYENTPYDYIVTQADVDADISGTLTLGQTLTRHRNKVKDWS